MAINNIGNNGQKPQLESQKLNQQQQAHNQVATNAKAQNAAAAAAPKQDSVSLTQSAQQLTQVQKKGIDAPINQEKVDRLKKAIQSGEYRVDPEKLASKIAKAESELFGVEKN